MADSEDHTRKLWIKYKSDYDYVFDKDDEERFFRVFNENCRFISNENNIRNQLFKCELNCTAHITHNEYQSLLIKEAFDPTKVGIQKKQKEKKLKGKNKKDVDWRISCGVTESKDIDYFWRKKYLWVQSILDCVESMYKIHKKTTIVLSFTQLEKELNEMANVGVSGLTQWALLQAQNVGFVSERSYEDDNPLQSLEEIKTYKIDGFDQIKPKDSLIKKALSHYGPLIANIDASEKSFRFYKSGIYNPVETKSKSTANHCVLLVGYDHTLKNGSWVVKNCWGKDWGNSGFINIDMKSEVCGVNSNVHVVY